MDLKSLSLSQRLAAGCGCVLTLVGVLCVVAYVVTSVWVAQRAKGLVADAPAGWMDSIRILARAPDLTGLLLARDQPGDGSTMTASLAPHSGVEMAYRAAVGMRPADHDDSTRWRQLAADTSLDQLARIARRTEWHAVAASLQGADSIARRNMLVFPLPTQRLGPVRDATRALVVRAMVRLGRGDRAGARNDLAAVTTLGDQVFRNEPTLLGAFVGRSLISSASRGWERYAARTGDSALAGRARVLLDWASRRPEGMNSLLLSVPDSAMAIAADTTLALGARGDALSQVVAARALTPRGFVFGMPARELARLQSLTEQGDPEMRQLAAVAVETARRLRFFGVLRLLREAGYRNP